MDIEWEAKFSNINKDKLRKRLRALGAKLANREFLQRRATFLLPKGHEVEGAWVRVRAEADKVTMTFKVVSGAKISDQKETTLTVNEFERARLFLQNIGCAEKSYQENKRELWILDDIEVTLDEWPFLEPFVELEGKSENEVKRASEKLGFDWDKAIFGSTHLLTSKKYGIPEDILNNKIPKIVFDMENPYLAWLKKHQK